MNPETVDWVIGSFLTNLFVPLFITTGVVYFIVIVFRRFTHL